MIELLAAVALAFTGQPVGIHCPSPWTQPQWAGFAAKREIWHIYMPRSTCVDLRKPPYAGWNVDTFTHEMVHVEHPQLRHGERFQRRVDMLIPRVRSLLRRYA